MLCHTEALRIMPTRNVVLTDYQARFVERLVDSGRYQNAREVLREGVRLVEQREAEHAAHIRALREAAAADLGDIDAGDYRSFEAIEPLRDHLEGLSGGAIARCDPDRGDG